MYYILTFLLGAIAGTAASRVFFKPKPSKQSKPEELQSKELKLNTREEKIINLIKEKGEVANNDVEQLLGVSDASATNYMQKLEDKGLVEQVGKTGRHVKYRLKFNG